MMSASLLRRLLAAVLLALSVSASGADKHDFRGAWIQTIYQGYDKRSTEENQAYLLGLLDNLYQSGINAVFFQVRPRADALYKSDIEPWSRFLTGTVGQAPDPYWDPLEFMVREAHARGMELHAWLNPYRAPTVEEYTSLPANDLLLTEPNRFVRYDKGYYFDPSMQANRDLICRIVADIAERYNVDGIHFDDYFYPYPVKGKEFPDAKAHAASRTRLSRAAWRRQNVDKLIEQVSHTLDSVRPGIRFGISPFGIWRNQKQDPRGSRTNGLSNFDDLYADVPLWAEKGWIDYQIPQLYWQMDHRVAPYRELAPWWCRNSRGRHVYIGQDAENISKFDELDQKLEMAAGVHGNCWWYAASLPCLADRLKGGAYKTPALVPGYPWKKVEPVKAPSGLRNRSGLLKWHGDPAAAKWVVYCFDSPDNVNLENPEAIVAVTYKTAYLPGRPGWYVVTALDRANGESAPSTPVQVK
ncbi:MAG: family 10 glycosylhydrolase [Bacteroides sp.]|nr:family 10 glycosylhydrolase [Bacteroides sp.]